MPATRIGQTPVTGIDKDENGVFVNDIQYTPECETGEQLNKDGEYIGVWFYRQRVQFQMTGEIPFSQDSTANPAFGMGTALALQNECPGTIWLGGSAPTGTTAVITGAPYQRTRDSVASVTVNGTIYPFAATA